MQGRSGAPPLGVNRQRGGDRVGADKGAGGWGGAGGHSEPRMGSSVEGKTLQHEWRRGSDVLSYQSSGLAGAVEQHHHKKNPLVSIEKSIFSLRLLIVLRRIAAAAAACGKGQLQIIIISPDWP